MDEPESGKSIICRVQKNTVRTYAVKHLVNLRIWATNHVDQNHKSGRKMGKDSLLLFFP